VRNSSLVERQGIDNKRASSVVPKLEIPPKGESGRGAFSHQRRCVVTHAGEERKANVGISNDKAGEKPAHRKTKVSCINDNRIRVSRGLRLKRKRKSMDSWLIFQHFLWERCRDGAKNYPRTDGIVR
jgi:hypothetical protein